MSAAASLKLALAAVLLWVTFSNAFWRMECRANSGHARIDPLMNFGTAAEHMHSVFGSSGFSESCDYSALRGGQCTSCIATEDKSAYWHPSLYFQAENGNFIMVPEVGGMLAYYNLNPIAGEKITAFPPGFQMIAGDNHQRNFTLPVPDPLQSSWASDPAQVSQQGLRAKAIGFNCLHYKSPPEGSLFRHFLPDKAFLDANCLDGIRTELSFPSCWNPSLGPTSANFKDHVAYPDLVLHGNCPSTHPVRLPGLFYEVIYDTYSFHDQKGQFVFANGDPTGFGYHGDFMTGWDEALLQSAINTCTNPSGLVQDCPLFTLQTMEQMQSCSFSPPDDLRAEIEAAKGAGGVSVLPGGIQIQSGPEYAKGPAPATPLPTPATSSTPLESVAAETPSSPAPSVPSPASPPPIASAAVVAVVDQTSTPTDVATTSAATSPPPPTPTPATTMPTPAPLQENQRVVTTSYSDMGNGVELELVIIEEDFFVTVSTTATATLPAVKPRDRHGIHRRAHGH